MDHLISTRRPDLVIVYQRNGIKNTQIFSINFLKPLFGWRFCLINFSPIGVEANIIDRDIGVSSNFNCIITFTFRLITLGLAPPHIPSPKPSRLNEQDMLSVAGDVRTDSLAMFFYGLLHMDTPVLADYQGITYISSSQTLDDQPGMMDKSNDRQERERERMSALSAKLDDDYCSIRMALALNNPIRLICHETKNS